MAATVPGAARHEARLANGAKPAKAVRVALLSDLHVHHRENLQLLPELRRRIAEFGCDVVIVAGDVSHRLEEVEQCLSSLKVAREHLFVPGNHDLWPVDEGSPPSRARHDRLLPDLCERAGWKYLPSAAPVRFASVAFFGVSGWPDGTLVGSAVESTGACEWEPREPDSTLALEDAGRLSAQLRRHASADPDVGLVLVTHFPASERAGHLVKEHGKALRAKDGQQLIERVWTSAVEEGLVHRAPDLALHGHKHGRYFEGDTACWALGYPWEAEKLAASGATHFAAIDIFSSAKGGREGARP